MKIKDVKDLLNSERDIKGVGFRSIRVLLEKDNMGFSLHKTIIDQGGPYHWHYKNHLESCYCIAGYGQIKNLETGEVTEIRPDMVYILDNHDNHTFTAHTNVELISVFNPPVKGNETHKADGSYE